MTRISTLLLLLFTALSVASGQSIALQHQVEPNTPYRWSLKMEFDKEIEQVRYEDHRGGSIYHADFISGSDSTYLQVRIVTGLSDGHSIPFQATVDSMYYSSILETGSETILEPGSADVDDIIIYGHFSLFDRMVIDSIRGTANVDQYNILYGQLDEVYRSLRWPNKKLILDTPLLKKAETPMLKSSSEHVLKKIDGEMAIVNYVNNKSGFATGEEKDRTEVIGTIVYNRQLKIIIGQTYQKTFTQIITYQNASFISDSKRTRTYDWRFEKL